MTSTGGRPALRGQTGTHIPVRPGYGMAGRSERGGRPGTDLAAAGGNRYRPRRSRPRPRDEFDDETSAGALIGLTVGWYALPGVLYLIWSLTVGSSRPSHFGQAMLSGLPWLAAAIVLSLIVAGLLRWAIVGWRGLTLSFASAVIGAGVATIAHSLSL